MMMWLIPCIWKWSWCTEINPPLFHSWYPMCACIVHWLHLSFAHHFLLNWGGLANFSVLLSFCKENNMFILMSVERLMDKIVFLCTKLVFYVYFIFKKGVCISTTAFVYNFRKSHVHTLSSSQVTHCFMSVTNSISKIYIYLIVL